MPLSRFLLAILVIPLLVLNRVVAPSVSPPVGVLVIMAVAVTDDTDLFLFTSTSAVPSVLSEPSVKTYNASPVATNQKPCVPATGHFGWLFAI